MGGVNTWGRRQTAVKTVSSSRSEIGQGGAEQRAPYWVDCSSGGSPVGLPAVP